MGLPRHDFVLPVPLYEASLAAIQTIADERQERPLAFSDYARKSIRLLGSASIEEFNPYDTKLLDNGELVEFPELFPPTSARQMPVHRVVISMYPRTTVTLAACSKRANSGRTAAAGLRCALIFGNYVVKHSGSRQPTFRHRGKVVTMAPW